MVARRLLTILCLVGLMIGGCSHHPTALRTQPTTLSQLADPQISDADSIRLTKAIRAQEPSIEERDVWVRIANSPQYSPAHRRRAVVQLFDRYVRTGMGINEVATILARPTWLREGQVTIIDGSLSPLPVHIVEGETLFVVFPSLPEGDNTHVYVRVSGDLTKDEFFKAIAGLSARNSPQVTAIAIGPLDSIDRSLTSGSRDATFKKFVEEKERQSERSNDSRPSDLGNK